MKKIQLFIAAFLLVVIGAIALAPASNVGAAALDSVCADNPDSKVCQNKDDSADGFVGALVNTLLFVVGAVSVIAVIIGGIMFATSGGNSGSITKAKNTITYAILGLVIAFFAYAIVNWVLKLFV